MRPATGRARHQRAAGSVAVGLATRSDARPRLTRLYQSGCAKAFLPRVHAAVPEVVLLNTAGGLTGGDRLDVEVDLGRDVCAMVTTQTAERLYGALVDGEPAQVRQTFHVGAGARLYWLPQETILFDRGRLDRKTEIRLASDASVLAAEMLVLGRLAMGETVSRLQVSDRRAILRDGKPVLAEPLELATGASLDPRDPAGLGRAKALATMWLVDPDAESRLAPVRRLLDKEASRVDAAASAWAGRLVIRAMSDRPDVLRRLVSRVLTSLAGGYLPRVWAL